MKLGSVAGVIIGQCRLPQLLRTENFAQIANYDTVQTLPKVHHRRIQ